MVSISRAARQGRLGFQKFPGLKEIASISKSVSRNLWGFLELDLFASTECNQIQSVVESRSTQPRNGCIPNEFENSGATLCFSPFFNVRENYIKGQKRGGGCSSNNNKLASTTLVQSGSRIICNQTSASTSVKQHLS